jgi:hypothetical protein
MLLSSWRIKVVTIDKQRSYSLTCGVPDNRKKEKLFESKIRFRKFIASLNFPTTFTAEYHSTVIYFYSDKE